MSSPPLGAFWKQYDPDTGEGDPSTPLSVGVLNSREAQYVQFFPSASDVVGLMSRPFVPAAGAGPTTVGASRVDAPSADTHNAFPGAVILPDRTMVLCWRGGPAHVGGSDGRIYIARSGDLGRTWGPPILVRDDVRDLRDPSLTVGADGRTLWLVFFSYNTPADPQLQSWVMRSPDLGSTWGPPVQVTTGAVAIASPVVQTISGTLVAPLYGPAGGRDSVWVAHSGDGGTSWSAPVVVANGASAGRDYQEPWLVDTPTGLVCLFRWGNLDGIARSVSTNGGATWTAPVRLFDGSGRPSAARTGTGALVCIYRDVVTRAAVMRTSRDDGITWGPQTMFDSDTVQMAYAAPVEVAPGVLAVPNSLERGTVSGSVATMHVRYVVDGPGLTPLGDTTLARRDAVQGRSTPLLAFDDFDRPDQALTTTPSGASWVTSGNIALRDGAARTTGTGVSLAYLTMAHGDVDVEADVRWDVNTGPALLVRGIDTTTYLMAAIESSGAAIRLYKVASGTATQLATTTEATRAGVWYRLRVQVTGDLVRVFLDGARIIAHTLTAPDAAAFDPVTARRVGFRMNATAGSVSSRARQFTVRGN